MWFFVNVCEWSRDLQKKGLLNNYCDAEILWVVGN